MGCVNLSAIYKSHNRDDLAHIKQREYKNHSQTFQKSMLRPVKDIISLCMPGVSETLVAAVLGTQEKQKACTRSEEHILNTKNEDSDKSTVAEHSKNTKHDTVKPL